MAIRIDLIKTHMRKKKIIEYKIVKTKSEHFNEAMIALFDGKSYWVSNLNESLKVIDFFRDVSTKTPEELLVLKLSGGADEAYAFKAGMCHKVELEVVHSIVMSDDIKSLLDL